MIYVYSLFDICEWQNLTTCSASLPDQGNENILNFNPRVGISDFIYYNALLSTTKLYKKLDALNHTKY